MLQKKAILSCLLLAILLAVSFQAGWPVLAFALPSLQSDCVKQIVGEAEIIANQVMDVNRDGAPDQIVLYINQQAGPTYDPIYVLVVSGHSATQCDVLLNEELACSKLTSGRQNINVRAIEMIELTGDDEPELHIWLERSGGGPRMSVAYHAIFTLKEERWKHVLGNKGIEQCLAFNTFKFRESPSGGAKDIYLDQDTHCEPPWSSERTWTIMRWDGSRFMPVDSGVIGISTTDPPWLNVCCVTIPIGFVVVLVLITRLRKKTIH
ncbi:MAG: hypothetical protein WHX52_22725 [Anaerolineae bacterium]